MSTGISRELQATLSADVIIVDRPVPDALGYYRAALSYKDDASPEAWAQYLTSIAEHHAKTYDLIFHSRLDPSIPLGTDKPRDTDRRFRKMADEAITELLAELRIDHVRLGPEGVADAVQLAVDRVRLHVPTPRASAEELAGAKV